MVMIQLADSEHHREWGRCRDLPAFPDVTEHDRRVLGRLQVGDPVSLLGTGTRPKSQERQAGPALGGLRAGPTTFPPTYAAGSREERHNGT